MKPGDTSDETVHRITFEGSVSLFNHLLRLDPALEVNPAHEYKNRDHTTLGEEIRQNPRLQKRDRAEFVEMMRNLNLCMPTHVTEALRTNLSGGKTIAQLLSEAAELVSFMSLDELKARVEAHASSDVSRPSRRQRCARSASSGRLLLTAE